MGRSADRAPPRPEVCLDFCRRSNVRPSRSSARLCVGSSVRLAAGSLWAWLEQSSQFLACVLQASGLEGGLWDKPAGRTPQLRAGREPCGLSPCQLVSLLRLLQGARGWQIRSTGSSWVVQVRVRCGHVLESVDADGDRKVGMGRDGARLSRSLRSVGSAPRPVQCRRNLAQILALV